ncbi:fused MFS/spermidine synthase [Aquabacterium sp. A08]|uniref:fused MFS/spermidine synthase n=1 Tax=Aquabacterium sp. A08 TaxID=2718532 RepID=UPI001423CACF|nr:fused MFS/spermidine synthase [Aquabacterium sp. A08]NIC42707.1 fused MFS/spermidine synthase [Aquabacterium sp. A08]
MPIFATTVFLSAFLLFQIQPIVAKMILPWFGGASSVWSLCLVFFQAELLLGYAYVHWMHEKLQAHRQMVLHGGLLLLSLLTLPVVANPAWLDALPQSPSLSVLLVLATTVGAPYLLLSTTGPLMQAWYARSSLYATSRVQPYRLYALSNLASMLGLLTYPVLVEPWLDLRPQALVWSTGYALFVVACLATAAVTWRGLHRATDADAAAQAAPRPPWTECLLWVGLAATATVLLLSITRHLTQDVAPVPFLWVLPLSLYLLSFILCFDAPRYYVRSAFLAALPVAFLALDWVMDAGMEVLWLIVLLCGALFVFCMVCHGELVRRKPPVRHLTLFYLMLSIGGALGGAFVGLLAPAVFNAYYELPIGLFACAALVTVVLWSSLQRHWRVLLLMALLAYGARLVDISRSYVQGYQAVMRNFYSQLRVDESTDAVGPVRSMLHGRINHGEQYLQEPHRRQPTAYYCELSGIGRAIRSLPQDRPLRLGVVGLGTGTLAAYGRPGDVMRIYEINDQVLSLARSHFTYLQDSGATIETALGDGRLVLEADPPQGFDLLAMDAFSGDSIPTHLLTLEALRGYLRHLAPQGLLAVHITNRYLDLEPVMATAAQALGRVAVAYPLRPPEGDLYCRSSTWVLLMTPAQAAQLPPVLAGGKPLTAPAGFRPWTDSFSNLLGILKD